LPSPAFIESQIERTQKELKRLRLLLRLAQLDQRKPGPKSKKQTKQLTSAERETKVIATNKIEGEVA
jgi:hypothetical protein